VAQTEVFPEKARKKKKKKKGKKVNRKYHQEGAPPED
jgi:hypothetical protein